LLRARLVAARRRGYATIPPLGSPRLQANTTAAAAAAAAATAATLHKCFSPRLDPDLDFDFDS